MIAATPGLDAAVWGRRQELPPSVNRPFLAMLSPGTRLDNAAELCESLSIPSSSDSSEILIEAWLSWGVEMTDRLRGAYAFALFDPMTRRLLLCRDPFGEAPLFYVVSQDHAAVAGSSRQARALYAAKLDANDAFYADFLQGTFASKEDTFFSDLFRLTPGSWLEIGRDNVSGPNRYWQKSTSGRRSKSHDDIALFRTLFDRAVARAYDGDRSALLLSGGLDSSAILGSLVANGVEPHDLSCIVKTYRATKHWNDERYLDLLQRRFSIRYTEVPSDVHDPLEDMEQWLNVLDGPYVSYGHSVASKLLKVASNKGLTSLLSGHGGDEVVGYGSGFLNELALRRRWIRLWREAKGITALTGQSRVRVFRKYLTHYPAYRRIENRILHYFPDPTDQTESSISSQLAKALQPDRHTVIPAISRSDHDEAMLHREALENPIQPLALETIGQCGRAVGVETRMPFYDRDLVELSLSLPADLKLRHGLTRYVLRQAMKERLPDDVLRRQTKYDFSMPFIAGMSENKERILDLAQTSDIKLRSFVNVPRLNKVRDLWYRDDAAIEVEDARFLWRCAVLAMWFAQIDHGPSHPTLKPF